MKSAGKARSNGLYRHIRTSKEIIRNLLNYLIEILVLLFSVVIYNQKKKSKTEVLLTLNYILVLCLQHS